MVIYWAAEMWKIMELFWPKKPVKCGANLLQNKKRIFAKNEKMNRQSNIIGILISILLNVLIFLQNKHDINQNYILNNNVLLIQNFRMKNRMASF